MAAGASRQAPAAPRLAVAASGGLDSTALLHCVHRLCAGRGIDVHALHVNHGLHPDADAWQAQLQGQCARWARSAGGLHFHAARLAAGPPAGASVEAWARRERYAALAAMAAASGCRIVLLAHHRRDQAETVLLQALRGAGPRGLAAMPRAAERAGLCWLRPWLEQPRERIEAYVRRWRLAFVDDPANHVRRYARNRVRHDVLAALAGAFPDAESALCDVARHAQEAAEVAAALAGIDAHTVVDGGALVVERWLQLGSGRRANVLRAWLASVLPVPVPGTLVERLLAELPGRRSGRWPAGGGGELRLHGGRLLSVQAGVAAPAHAPLTVDLSPPGLHPIAPWPGALRVQAGGAAGVPAELLRRAELRVRSGGEQFQAHAASPPRSLKKQYQAAGVPPWQRAGPLVFGGGQLIFVPGLGIDARARALPGADRRTLDWQR